LKAFEDPDPKGQGYLKNKIVSCHFLAAETIIKSWAFRLKLRFLVKNIFIGAAAKSLL